MTDTAKRIVVGAIIAAVFLGVAALEHFGIPASRWLAVLIVLGMMAELVMCFWHTESKRAAFLPCFIMGALLMVMLCAAYVVGGRPWIMLLLLMTICGADIGAWGFGTLIGGDKMWERMSAHKTWSGQIAGIVCGTFMAVLYGLLGTDTFMPQLMWIGISVSLLSQYGDLTASWVKRKIGIKDFGRILPGHGGVLDRFDGWIYALPLVWLVML